MMALPLLAAETARPRQGAHAFATDGSRSSLDPRCLIDAVEFDVIPRLLDAHRGENLWAELTGPGGTPVSVDSSVCALTDLVLDQAIEEAMALVDGLRARGSGIRAIYLDLLSASAHRLGRLWEDDEVTFAEVTIGLCGLHQILYRLSPQFRSEATGPLTGRRALLAPAPQETHFFGVLMAADFFARAGWQVWTEVEADPERLATLIREEEFDLVGFSISCEAHLERTGAVIDDLRRAVARPLRVIAGGRAVSASPGQAQALGADGLAHDAEHGLRLASSLLDKESCKAEKTEPSSSID